MPDPRILCPALNEQYLVFISHAGTDAWIARQIQRSVRGTGAQAFLSELDVSIGDDFSRAMRSAMAEAKECLVLYTPEAASSRNVWIEIGGAWMAGKRIVLVLNRYGPNDITGDPRFPPYLKSLEFSDLNGDFDSVYLPQLEKRARTFLCLEN